MLYIEDNLANLRLVEQIIARRPAIRLVSAMPGRVRRELAAQHRLVQAVERLVEGRPAVEGAELLDVLRLVDRLHPEEVAHEVAVRAGGPRGDLRR